VDGEQYLAQPEEQVQLIHDLLDRHQQLGPIGDRRNLIPGMLGSGDETRSIAQIGANPDSRAASQICARKQILTTDRIRCAPPNGANMERAPALNPGEGGVIRQNRPQLDVLTCDFCVTTAQANCGT
jgi:hypothetical protein